MKKITEEEINEALKSATASVEIEGLKTYEELNQVIKKRLRKEITNDQYIDIIKKFAIKIGAEDGK